MSRFNGTVGAALLIAGSCIGAGMLGLPLISAQAGFLPSSSMFVLGWFYMLVTGMLLLEVNLWSKEELSLITMAERTLGRPGKVMTWGLFLFLFYALLVAYFSGGGSFIQELLGDLFDLHVPLHWASTIALVATAPMVYLGTSWVDRCNRVFMVGLFVSYFSLIVIGAPKMEMERLQHANWNTGFLLLPVMVISYGYHNLLPSLTTYLDYDARSMRRAILGGSALALGFYLVWQTVILGISGEATPGALDEEAFLLNILRGRDGASTVALVMDFFSFFAIVTSLLGVALSFVDFLADGFHSKRYGRKRLALTALTVLPPFAISLSYPQIFLKALGYAGAFGAVTLFGIMPVIMVWIGRYRQGRTERQLLPFGRVGLLFVTVLSLFIMSVQAMRMCS